VRKLTALGEPAFRRIASMDAWAEPAGGSVGGASQTGKGLGRLM